jgi:hypothetical protein
VAAGRDDDGFACMAGLLGKPPMVLVVAVSDNINVFVCANVIEEAFVEISTFTPEQSMMNPLSLGFCC